MTEVTPFLSNNFHPANLPQVLKKKVWEVFPARPFKSRYFSNLLKAVQEGEIDVIKNIISIDPYVVYSFDSNRKTALHHAIGTQNYDVVLCLLSKKADPNMEDSFGWPCLAHAIMLENLHIM